VPKGNEVDIPQADGGFMWQHKRTRRHRRLLLEELSFLLNSRRAIEVDHPETWLC
jgi:hypothetical protein